MVKNQVTKQRGQRILGDCWQGKPTGSVLMETIAVSVTMSINVQKGQSRIRLRILSRSRMKEKRGEPEVPEESPSGRMSRWPCKDYLKGTCTK